MLTFTEAIEEVAIKADKSTKAEAEYQGVPNSGEQCADCTMYVVPSRCTAVEGYIAPYGWCKFFERKASMVKVLFDDGDLIFGVRENDDVGKYDETQHPRDEHGRWTDAGGGKAGAEDHGAASGLKPQGGNRGAAGSGNVGFQHVDSTRFRTAIEQATAGSKYGAAVHLYESSAYRDMQTFLTSDGKAGFALHGNDIVSVFKDPSSTTKGVASAALQHAVAAGGQRLDAFDTVLPGLYSDSGFRAVARLPWNDEYKPSGWDYKTFGKFNGGRPDVVFMVHDPSYGRSYRPDDGARVNTYEEGVAVQEAELRRLRKSEEQTMSENLREAVYAYLVKNNAADIAALMAPDIAVKAAEIAEAEESSVADTRAEVEKLKIKHKVSFDADPDEIKALVEALKGNSSLESILRQAFPDVSVVKAMRTLKFYRHGATHLNDRNTSVDRIRGWKDVPLTPEGKEEAVKLAEKVAKDPPDHLVSSDMKRAHDTAKIIAKAADMKVDEASEWARPWNVGKFAGQPSKTAVPQLVEYAITKPDEAVPGGESFNSFCERFCTGLADAFDKYDGTLGLVSHHRNERLLKAMEAADWEAIDGKTFGKKGEGTAGHETIEIPTAKLRKNRVMKFVNPPDDFSKIWQDDDEFDPDIDVFDTHGSSDAAHDWAIKRFLTIEKLAPGVADVHVPTALGNENPRKKRKAKDFLSTIGETHPKVSEGDVGKDESEEAGDNDDLVEWDGGFKVSKTDEEQQLVFGWASVTHVDGELVVDKQDDVITSEELEKAAYEFVLYCREQGDMHRRIGVGKLVESTVYTVEKSEKCGLFAFDVETGKQMLGWWTGFRVADPGVWKRIKAGDLPEFSIGGRAVRVPM